MELLRKYQECNEEEENEYDNSEKLETAEHTMELSELAQVMMNYLGCECKYFPPTADDDSIMSAYKYVKRNGARKGFVPVLIQVDELLYENLVMNSDPNHNELDKHVFDPDKVIEYRNQMLSAPMKDGKAVLEERICRCKARAKANNLDWEKEILGEIRGGYRSYRFVSHWDFIMDMTYPLILAKIPVKNPWEIFAYLPFSSWNDSLDVSELMAVAKYWFKQYGAVPSVITYDALEFELPAPIPKEKAMEAAIEQYGFCPDTIDQGLVDMVVGNLADILRKSTVWYFRWN